MRESATKPARVIPALGPVYDALSSYADPLLRIACGLMLVPHGWGKLFRGGVAGTAKGLAALGLEPAIFWAWYIGILEVFGGLMLALGLLTRPVAALVAGFMFVAAFYAHWGNGFFWINRGYEYPLFWGIVALVILVRGGGKWSLDARIGKEV